MNKIKLTITILGLILVGCSDDDNPASSTVTLTEGTYNITAATAYDTADCSGTGSSGMCTTDETATTEATCPSGACMDGVNTTEATCPADMWLTAGCMDGVNTTETTCSSGAWIVFGWTTLAEVIALSDQDESITIAGGVLTYSEGIPGTYTIDGTTISITDPAGCWDYEEEVAVEVADEAACDAAGSEWEEATILSGTLNADGTITVEQIEPAECYDDEDEEVEAADEAACDAANGSWEDASCMSLVLTLSTSQ